MGGVAFAAVTQDDDPTTSPEVSDSPTADGQASDKPSSSATSTPEQSPSQEQTNSPAAPPATSGGRVGFLQDYFSTVPGDLDTGWSMLSPRMQAEVGRDSYDGFWGTVSSVEASDFSPHGNAVDLTLRYTMNDGSVQVERHRIDLVRGDNGYLVDDDTAIG